jgi:hypothetical protein
MVEMILAIIELTAVFTVGLIAMMATAGAIFGSVYCLYLIASWVVVALYEHLKATR